MGYEVEGGGCAVKGAKPQLLPGSGLSGCGAGSQLHCNNYRGGVDPLLAFLLAEARPTSPASAEP